jgi:hypothetical protein
VSAVLLPEGACQLRAGRDERITNAAFTLSAWLWHIKVETKSRVIAWSRGKSVQIKF